MITFTAQGHPAVRASHATTLEFTKDKRLTRHGDCIIAVGADFSKQALQELVKEGGTLRVTITVDGQKEVITGTANPLFNDAHEIVLRLGEFVSGRTLIVRADKAAKHIRRELVEFLKDPRRTATVTIEKVWTS